MGLDINEFKLQAGVFGAEPWTEEMRREIERRLHIKAYDIYGLSEIIGPGVSFECEAQGGMHINEDYFIPEIINPDTGEVLPAGEQGRTCVYDADKGGASAHPLQDTRYHVAQLRNMFVRADICAYE